MATDEAFDQIRSFVESRWADAALTCPIAWDNEEFTEPKPYDADDLPQHWGKVLIDGKLWSLESIGSGDPVDECWEEIGDLTFFAIVPVGTGSRRCRQVLTEFAQMCRGQEAGAVTFGDIIINPIGSTDAKGVWWTMSIVIEWKRG